MKKGVWVYIAFFGIFFFSASLVNASIIGWNCDDDGDGAIVMDTPNLTWDEGLQEYTLSMGGTQYWHPAHVEGDFDSDTELDPTVWIAETVENQTNFNWTDYHIDIGMTKVFSISTSVIAPDNWTWIVTQPIAGQPIPNGGTGWLGTIDFYQGTGSAINIGDSGDFGFKVSFLGDVAFCTEQVPTPEPATICLLGLGGLLLRRKRSRA